MPLSIAQVKALADALPPRNRAMVVTQAGLGLRLGELLALRVVDVDLVGQTARVEWQFAPQSKVRSVPKTPRSRRTIPLPQVVVDALSQYMKEFRPAEDGTIFGTTTRPYCSCRASP